MTFFGMMKIIFLYKVLGKINKTVLIFFNLNYSLCNKGYLKSYIDETKNYRQFNVEVTKLVYYFKKAQIKFYISKTDKLLN